MVEVQKKILGIEKADEHDFNYLSRKILNDTGNIEYFINLVLVLRKGKKIIMNLFAELREKRLFGVISKPEKILFEKVLILYEEQILRDSEKIVKNLREGKDTNCLYLNDNENFDDNNDEEPDEDSYNEIIELLTNTKIKSVYGDSNLFVIMKDVEIGVNIEKF